MPDTPERISKLGPSLLRRFERERTPLLSRGGVDARSRRKLRSHHSSRRRGGAGQEILTSTTPSAPTRKLRNIFFGRGHPSSAEEGSFLLAQDLFTLNINSRERD